MKIRTPVSCAFSNLSDRTVVNGTSAVFDFAHRAGAGLFGSVGKRDPVVRRLAPIALLNTLGNGMFYTTSALYFTRVAGVSVAQLGVGLTVAALFAIVISTPIGRLSDRVGAKNLVWPLWIVESCGVLLYTQVNSFSMFLVLVSVVVSIDRSALVAFRAFLATGISGESRVEARAYIRALSNLGTAVGAAAGAAALQLDSPLAYRTVLVVDAITFLVSAILFLRLPASPKVRQEVDTVGEQMRDELRVSKNYPYVAICLLAAVLTMQAGLLEVGLPLWISGHTAAPRWVVAAALFINTLLVAGLQVRFSRGTGDVSSAARICRRAGWLVAAACLAYGAAGWLPAIAAAAILLVAIVVHTLAEVWFAAGSTSLSFELAPQALAGAYQGVFQTGFGAGLLLAPLVVTNTALRIGFLGWAALAIVFVGAGVLFVPASKWASSVLMRETTAVGGR